MTNLDATELENWKPVGSLSTPFSGTFDGNGYTISNLHVNVASDQPVYAGLFGYAKNATIKNVTMENSEILANNTSFDSNTSVAYAGSLIGFGYNVTITNCVTSGNVTADANFKGYAGGFVGFIDSDYNKVSTISSGENHSIVSGKTDAGGFVGGTYSGVLKDVKNSADIISSESRYNGGIVGEMSQNATIENTINEGNITYSTYGGGIVAYATNGRITKSHNNGKIEGKSISTDGGGIIGSGSSLFLQGNENHGSISSVANGNDIGGIAGSIMGQSTILQSFNTGEIKGPTGLYTYGRAGGIVGYDYSSLVAQTYNTAPVMDRTAGGIAGSSSSGTIQDSFNLGNITGSTIGGILGTGTGGSIKQTMNLGRTNVHSSVFGNLVSSFTGSLSNNVYYVASKDPSFNGTGVKQATFEEMKQSASFEGFDFQSVWTIGGDTRYLFPRLKELPEPTDERSLVVSMSSLPTKTVYKKDESLDLTGAKLTTQTSFGNSETIPVTNDMVSGFDGSKPGVQYLTVSYNDASTSFDITVKNRFTVTFKDDKGNVLKTQSVDEGENATPPVAPSRDGYTFSGWSGDTSTDTSTITSNMTFTAVYTMDEYTITVMDNGKTIEQYKVGSQYTVDLPTIREIEGYTLLGWYSDALYQTHFTFFERVTKDTTIYAQYVKNPDVIKGFKVTGSSTFGVKLAWEKVDGATGYDFASSTSPNGPFNTGGQVGDVNTLHADYYKPGQTIYFKIRAYKQVKNGIAYGPYSEVISGKTIFQGVNSVKVSGSNYESATLTWSRSTTPGKYEEYEVLRSTSVNGTYKVVGTVYFGQKTTFTDHNLATGTTYYYKIRAYEYMMNVKYTSPLSSAVSVTPVLPAVKSLKIASTGYQSVRLDWLDTLGATGFEIYRGSSSTGKFTLVKSYPNNNTKSFSDSKLATGKRVYYKVRAVRVVSGKKVYGPYTTVSTIPVLQAPAKITISKASSTSAKVVWSKVSEASGYEIVRATNSKGTYSLIKTITSGSTLNYTNTNITKGKTYYYKVRSYRTVSGKKIYSSYTRIASIKI
ncbi:InlB B-repeat-containing protein [Bacillus sp. AFS001701]|uniref:InlB B-repeat-containing protein n=1 Tax=Bacillus sp. AFS001701 TaxID=2033480 RepID=UPI001596F975|nr:InlB B-repeat-containing protein [Bacillus sp. AFS001701]